MNNKGVVLRKFTQYLCLAFLSLNFLSVWAQPAGFVNEKVADTNGAISFNFLPDGRVLVLEKDGTILIGDPTQAKPITLNTYMQVPNVNDDYEAGLLNLVLDPNFSSNNFFYVIYSHTSKYRRVSKFTHQENSGGLSSTGDAGSEQVLWQDTEPVYTNGHLGGAMGFGNDQKLYFVVGDGFKTDGVSQNLGSSFGKVHRINGDGSIPGDNPYNDGTPGLYNGSGVLKSIYAYGIRNPFKGNVDPNTNRMFVGEVGGNGGDAHEDLHRVELGTGGSANAGTNYGWPYCGESGRNGDGSCSSPAYEDPIFAYKTYPSGGQVGTGASITAGVVYRGSVYPGQYQGAFFFGDYVRKFIKYLTLDGSGNVTGEFTFENDAGKSVDVRQGPDGMIYYLKAEPGSSLGPGALHRYLYNASNQPPLCINVTATETEIDPGEAIGFDAQVDDPNGDPMTYEWDFGDGIKVTGNVPGNDIIPTKWHTFNDAGTYTAQLKLSDGNFDVFCDEITITVGSPPVATINSPTVGDKFIADDVIVFDGSATGGTPPLVYTWSVELWHDEHTHPTNVTNFVGSTGTFTVPHDDHSYAGNVGYRFYLTVTDDNGLSDTEVVSIDPDKIDITVNTNQPAAAIKINIDGVPLETPLVVDQMIGYHQTLEAPITQCVDGVSYQFLNWSDGESSNQRVYVTPNSDVTLTANYTQGAILPQGWLNQDIGFVAAAGGLCYDSQGIFSVSGSGEGIQGIDDEFHYVYRSCEGDAEITARIIDVENTADWARSGVMIRETLSDQSKSIFLDLAAGGNMSWHIRAQENNGSSWNQNGGVTAPHWLKITRTGDDFTYSHSTNGLSWSDLGTVNIEMDDDIFIGLAHTSQNDGIVGIGQFDNVSYTCVDNTGIVFPVELLNFNGREVAQSIVLDWQTSLEENNDFFLVERSVDGRKFNTLAKVSSKGNGEGRQTYTTTDSDPRPGINYYRLRQRDLDGKMTTLKVIEVNYNHLSADFARVYPNPVRSGELVNVELDIIERGDVAFEIVNMLGQTMSINTFSLNAGRHEVQLPVDKLSEGYYTIVIRNNTQKLIRKMAVKK